MLLWASTTLLCLQQPNKCCPHFTTKYGRNSGYECEIIFNIAKSIVKTDLNHTQSIIRNILLLGLAIIVVFSATFGKKEPTDQLSINEVQSIFQQIPSIDVLRITGGEPFVCKDPADLINVIDESNDPAVIHITTNGINTKRIAQSLRSVKSLRKVHIKVSIDDFGEKHDKIRGVKGAYEKAVSTLKELVVLRDEYGTHVGVNQAILDENSMGSYRQLKTEFAEMDIPIYASIAYDSSSTLYSEDPDKRID